MQSQLTAVSKRLVSLSLPQISCALCAVSQSLSCIPRVLWAVSKSFVSQSLSCISRALWAVSKSFVSQYLSLSLSLSLAHRLTSSLLSSQRRCNVASLYAALRTNMQHRSRFTWDVFNRVYPRSKTAISNKRSLLCCRKEDKIELVHTKENLALLRNIFFCPDPLLQNRKKVFENISILQNL